jgi:hypothetical protein
MSGYHFLWSITAQVVGTPEQIERENKRYVEGETKSGFAEERGLSLIHVPGDLGNYFFGGAVNPRDSDLKVTEASDGKHIVFSGRKAFSTGSKVSDLSMPALLERPGVKNELSISSDSHP